MISKRSMRKLHAAAHDAFVEIVKADWEPIRAGGEMCGPVGGWTVVIRELRRKKYTASAVGMNLGQVCDDILREGKDINYLANSQERQSQIADSKAGGLAK